MNDPITINGRPFSLVWGSNSPLTPGGFGQQTRLITKSLRDRLGVRVAVSASYGQMNGKLIVDGIDVYPCGYRPYGNDIHAANAQQHGADILLTHQDVPWQDPHALTARGTRWASWFPVDHTPLSSKIAERIGPEFCYQPIALSRFGERQARAAGIDIRLVLQGIDTSVFVPGDRTVAREKLGWPKDAFIVGTVAQNRGYPDRKAYPEQIRAFRAFAERHSDALIYIHAFGNDELDPEARTDIPGHLGDMLGRALWAHPYDLNLGYSTEQMVLRYQAFDVLLGVSMAEGFGLPLIEAQSCGVPVITGAWTATEENCYAGWLIAEEDSTPWYVTPYGPDCLWRLPHIGAIVEKLEAAYCMEHCTHPGGWVNTLAESARTPVVANHDQAHITDTSWRAVLTELAQRIEAEPIPWHRHQWASYGHQNGRGVVQPCLVPSCPAERAGDAVAPRGFPLTIDGIELDIEDDPNGGQRYAIASEITSVYHLHELIFKPGDVVVDVGAHVGIVSCYLAKKWPEITVYAFEPIIANFERLDRNVAANRLTNVHTCPLAITADGRDLELSGDPATNSGHYSAFAERGPFVDTAPSMTLSDLRSEQKFDRIALLKLDCEGAEYEILHSLGALLGTVDAIVMEAHEKLKLDCDGTEYEILHGMGALLAKVDAVAMEAHENERLRAAWGSGTQLIEFVQLNVPWVRASVIAIPDAEEVNDAVD
jgi:FkbM family methyltransferase